MFNFTGRLGRKSVTDLPANVLLIIDMQIKFLDPQHHYQSVVNTTVDYIHYAKKHNEYIVVVEYDYGRWVSGITYDKIGSPTEFTHKDIKSAIGNYDRFTYVYKGSMGGGNQVVEALRSNEIQTDRFKVCGVYAPWCVKETVNQLRNLLPNSYFHLVKDGIAASNNDPLIRDNAFSEMTFYDAITVVG